jgi:hypothetical protein
MTLVRLNVRPPQVNAAITELMELAVEIESRRSTLTEIALALKELGADTTAIADASHDLEHAWRHLTSVRRALVMAWPDSES